ncbi:MAG TPA: START domain-containing protein [Spirochaetota bacterium]|nr:START domain-containing protein [Spirochaetota bacterium]
MKRLYPLILICIFITAALLPAFSWERVKNSGGITISVQKVEGSEIKEFMAVTVVESSLSSIIALLDDTKNYTSWNYRCSEAKLLYKKNDYERITYMVTGSPWPVAERDIAVRSVISQDKSSGVVTVSLKGLPGYTSEMNGRVRMTSLRGYWRLEPLGGGNIRVIYRLHSEPGGSVPDSIVNSSLVDIPYNTLWNMRNFVKRSPYRDAVYTIVKEKK